MSSKKNLQKLLKTLQGKKKKKPTTPSARLEALRGKKYFRRGGSAEWLVKVYMQTFTLKENVEVRCERKVQRAHQKHLTSKEQNKQRGKDNDKVMS